MTDVNDPRLFNVGASVPTSPAFGGEMNYASAIGAFGSPGTGGGPSNFTWQNPYAYQGWGVGAAEGAGFGGKLGSYLGGNAALFGAGFDILSKGVGAYTSIKGLGLAEKQLKLEQERYRTNLANSVKSYNTQMSDRIAGRSYATEAERVAALSAASLPDPSKKGG